MEGHGQKEWGFIHKVNARDLLRKEDIGDLGRLLHAYFSGSSFTNLAVQFPQFDVGPAELCRWVHTLVDATYALVDESFVDGHIFGLPLVNISTSLETDEKEISTMPDGIVPVFKHKLKHGRPVNSANLAGIYEQGVASFCIVQEIVGRTSIEDLKLTRVKLKHRLGDRISRLQHDRHVSYAEADDTVLGEGIGVGLRHILLTQISPNKIAEGNNKSLNKKFESVQSESMPRGRWLFYDFAAPFQDNGHPEFTGWTRFEIAIGYRLGVPGFEWLLQKLADALEGGWTCHLLLEDNTARVWSCMEGLLSKKHEKVFTERVTGMVFCIACQRDLVPPETPAKHLHDYRRTNTSVVDLSQVRKRSQSALDRLRMNSSRSPEFEHAFDALVSANSNPHMAVFAWCTRPEDPWFAIVLNDLRGAKKYLRWLRRHQRVRRVGPAGMAAFRSAYPEVESSAVWIISPFGREKVARKDAIGFWKNCGDIVKHSRFRRSHRYAKQEAQAGIGLISAGFAYLDSKLKGKSGKL